MINIHINNGIGTNSLIDKLIEKHSNQIESLHYAIDGFDDSDEYAIFRSGSLPKLKEFKFSCGGHSLFTNIVKGTKLLKMISIDLRHESSYYVKCLHDKIKLFVTQPHLEFIEFHCHNSYKDVNGYQQFDELITVTEELLDSELKHQKKKHFCIRFNLYSNGSF
eukprot:385112_1